MLKRVLPALVCLVLLAQTAGAHLIAKPARCPKPTPAAPSLQQILDGLVVSGPAIDAGAPLNIELWDNASGPMSANIVVDDTGRSNAVWFGMDPADDSGNHAFVLSGNMSPNDVASVSFSDDGSITISGGHHKPKASGFDGPFGFFVKIASVHGESPVYLFTDADLNGGEVRAKVFQGNGTTILKFPGQSPGLFLTNQYLIAFETGHDGAFNDFIVSVSNIVAVPEPAIAWLLGFSALAVLSGRRVRST